MQAESCALDARLAGQGAWRGDNMGLPIFHCNSSEELPREFGGLMGKPYFTATRPSFIVIFREILSDTPPSERVIQSA